MIDLLQTIGDLRGGVPGFGVLSKSSSSLILKRSILVDFNLNHRRAFSIVISDPNLIAIARRGRDICEQQIAGSLVLFRIAVTDKILLKIRSQRALPPDRIRKFRT
jgi:hypothetical protein